jgi:hypothetical protein
MEIVEITANNGAKGLIDKMTGAACFYAQVDGHIVVYTPFKGGSPGSPFGYWTETIQLGGIHAILGNDTPIDVVKSRCGKILAKLSKEVADGMPDSAAGQA